jgi:DNA mismatch repair protein MutS2
VDLAARTLRTLDWDVVVAALADATRTPMGAERARGLVPLATHAEVLDAYGLVEALTAVRRMGDGPPVDAVGDIRVEVGRAARGMILEPWALISAGRCLAGLVALHGWLDRQRDERLRAFLAATDINRQATLQLGAAFDPDGTLSDRAWPALRALRERVQALRTRVHDTLAGLLADEGWGDLLMDRYVTERNGRLVLPVRIGVRRGLGIVHGTSASGETAFVEPGQTVELQNDLREATDALEQEQLRILGQLSAMLGRLSGSVLPALEAVGVLDLGLARAELGLRWAGSTPEVRTEGVVRLRRARHPLLVLRGVAAVGNDLVLDDAHRALVLTGPNAGGKTVALKTIGLCAVCVRAGLPIPVDEGSRLDLFDPILADIGDLQSVADDLSTFSGHLAVLREALVSARPGALVLVDEVAVGTDPAQGAALAAAVLEALVARGARAVVTTHYPELKALDDPRITLAGMEFAEGRPTYRLVPGSASSSQALVIAHRMGVPAEVLDRARALLDAGAARLARLAEQLDTEREEVARVGRALETREAGLAAREAELGARQRKLDALVAGERARLVEATRERLRELERELRERVKEVHQGGRLQDLNAALGDLRAARDGLEEAEAVEANRGFVPVVGARVWVDTVEREGRVLAVSASQVEVEVRGLRMRVPRGRIGPPRSGPVPPPTAAPRGVDAPPSSPAEAAAPGGLRLPGNTCDLRGMRLAEAEEAVLAFVSRLKGAGERYGYLLHGHGTGVLKTGLRARLKGAPGIIGIRPADLTEGGDAFTVVEL